jgi:hypothetical protein
MRNHSKVITNAKMGIMPMIDLSIDKIRGSSHMSIRECTTRALT